MQASKNLNLKVDDELLAINQSMASIISNQNCQQNIYKYQNQ